MQVLKSLCDKFVRLCGKESFIAACSSVVITEFQLLKVPTFTLWQHLQFKFLLFAARNINRASNGKMIGIPVSRYFKP